MTSDSEQPAEPARAVHPNLRHLPLGRRVEPRYDFGAWSTFPYEFDGPQRVRILDEPVLPEPPRLGRVRILDEPVLPEPPRLGEPGGEECVACSTGDDAQLWTDELWRLHALSEPSASPAVVILEPRAHCDLGDLPERESAQLGPLIQRVERAILGLGGIGRVHIMRWGDGASHLHWWFLARPEGMLQLRGAFMPIWDDVLPALDHAIWQANLARIAAALAADGGTAHVTLASG